MPLNPTLLAETFRRAASENGGAHSLGLRFYERLFDKYPTVRPLFNTPPEEQHKKLLASIGAIVAGVNHTELLIPYLHAMGIRHLKYGTENGHYAAVGENLIAVLREHLSVEGNWTQEMETAWNEALTLVASIMIEAADAPEKFEVELVQSGYLPDGFKPKDPEPWLLPV